MKTLYGGQASEKYNTQSSFLESIGQVLKPKDFIIFGKKDGDRSKKKKENKKKKHKNNVSPNKQSFRGTYFSES